MSHSQLKTRLISAAVLLAAAILLTIISQVWVYGVALSVGAVAVLSGMCAFEMARLFSRDSRTLRYQPYRGGIVFLALLAPQIGAVWSTFATSSSIPQSNFEPFVAGLGIGLAILCAVVCWAGRNEIEEAATLGRGLGVGAVYLVGGSSAIIAIAGLPGGIGYMWWLIGVVALGDTAAYFIGKAIGGPKVAPALSPNKTVSGSVGGLAASALTGLIFWRYFVDPFGSVVCGLLIGLLVGASGQIGDLTKSYLKRLRGVKDFGAIIPGHGGILDRCDGFLGGALVMLAAILILVPLGR